MRKKEEGKAGGERQAWKRRGRRQVKKTCRHGKGTFLSIMPTKANVRGNFKRKAGREIGGKEEE